jgi:hypothetical protein
MVHSCLHVRSMGAEQLGKGKTGSQSLTQVIPTAGKKGEVRKHTERIRERGK